MNEFAKMIGGNETDEPRGAKEIAVRSLCVFTLIEHAMREHEEAEERRLWLEEKGLAQGLTDLERQYLYSDSPTVKQDINATWLSECLCVLLWSIGYLVDIPEDSEKFDPADHFDIIPGYSDVTVEQFINGAMRRPVDELYEMAKDIQWAHGLARSKGHDQVTEILQERHLAINWVIGYCGLPWHLVTTDT